jgi:hypothetical protein
MQHVYFFQYLLLIAIIAGAIRYRRIEPPVLRWLVPFLVATFVVEAIGTSLSRRHQFNLWLYDPWTAFEFLFYSYLYTRILEDPKWVKIIQYAMLIYPVLFLVDILFLEKLFAPKLMDRKFHTYTYRIGSIMVVTWAYLYFRQLMRSPDYIPVLRDPVFWVSSGLMLFYTGNFFFFSSTDILMNRIPQSTWQALEDPLNILLYGSFLIALLCQRTVTKRL